MKENISLTFADHAGQFYARHSNIPPIAGRLLGYLIVCEPKQQSINQLAESLKASRSAIVGAVQVLENRYVVKRTRIAGNRSDLISFDIDGFENRGFDGATYTEQAGLFKEGLTILKDTTTETQIHLEELMHFAKFLAERMPVLQQEWHKKRNTLRKSK